MTQPKNETENLLLSNTKNCETFFKQTRTKLEETLEFELTKPRETFHLNRRIPVLGSWMIGLTSLEVYNSIFNITEENNKFKLYLFPDSKTGRISIGKVRDEIEKDLDISDNTATDTQDEKIVPTINEENRKEVSKAMEDGEYMNILAGYTSSIFQDFESYLRREVDLVEDHIRLVLDVYNSNFITCELLPGVYTFRDLSEVLLRKLQLEFEGVDNAIVIEFDDISMKTKLVVRSGIVAIKFDGKSPFSTVLGFHSHWDYEHYDKYISQRIVSLSTKKFI